MHAKPPTLFTLLVSLLWRYQRRLHAVNRSARNEHPSFSSARLTLFWPTFAAIVISGCADSNESLINEKAQAGPTPRPALIATLEQPSDRILHEFVGKVDAAQTVDLSFEVSGQLASVTPREGDRLAEGSLIAALDPTPFEIRVREAKAQFELAELDLRRKRALLKDKAISPALVDQASAQLDLARSHLEMSERHLSETRLVAPFDGLLSRRYVDNHSLAAAGQAIVRLSDLTEIFVRIAVPERLVSTINDRTVTNLWARLPGMDTDIPLALKEFAGEANAVAQSYRVTLVMTGLPPVDVLPGMNVTVYAERAMPNLYPRIPLDAIHESPDGSFYVWRYANESQTVTRQPVRVGDIREGQVEIKEGLKPGDRFAAAGGQQLREGMRVRPMTPAQPQ